MQRSQLKRMLSSRKLCAGAACASTALAVYVPERLYAYETPTSVVTRIEEDWEIVLDEPGDDLGVPQFHTVMSPYGSQNSTYFQVSWNYRDMPSFESGGLQLQVWNGESFFASRDIDGGPLSNSAETVRWTQLLSVDDRDLTFAVTGGYSSSWGSFGGESMTVRMPRAMHSLSGYSTSISTGGSWVTYGTNRVVRLQITEIRTYDDSGMLSRDTTPRIVFQFTEESDD